jgi:hypothetical protein
MPIDPKESILNTKFTISEVIEKLSKKRIIKLEDVLKVNFLDFQKISKCFKKELLFKKILFYL